eukprot:TRINITY_DN10583_c0_g1_i1.p2 TRINITY_DN10583_c0_g1~~TRINITY_DN10583_c0_g1_i1.p2  ORF type:complete len:56 (+),score=19.52 TRINITY_DN10583_c0_g1_i1:55-222(+)
MICKLSFIQSVFSSTRFLDKIEKGSTNVINMKFGSIIEIVSWNGRSSETAKAHRG